MNNTLEQLKQAEALRRAALANLHLELGYPTAQALAGAILDAAGGTRAKATVAPPASTPRPKSRPTAGGSKRGRRLPPETRQKIMEALKSGRPGTHVMREFGISYPTVHLMKQKLGLVNARKG